MKRQLRGIGIVLISIGLMILNGNEAFFDFGFNWGTVYEVIALIGVCICLFPKNKKEKNDSENN